MKFAIGADAGGTKTRAAAYLTNGVQPTQFAEYTAGAGNLALDYFSARCEILSAIRAVFSAVISAYPNAVCELIAVGAAGASAKIDGERAAVDVLRHELASEFGCRVEVMSDVMLAYTAAFGAPDESEPHSANMVVISGTGSIVMLHCGSRLYRAGGYGHLIGDGGSGYFTGISAIRRILTMRDRGTPETKLESAVLDHIGLSSYVGLISWVYAAERKKSDIAGLSAVINSLASAGSSSAASIISESGAALASDAANAVFRASSDNALERGAKLRAALYGGNLTKSDVFRNAFAKSAAEQIGMGAELTVLDSPPEPTYASAVMARELTNLQ